MRAFILLLIRHFTNSSFWASTCSNIKNQNFLSSLIISIISAELMCNPGLTAKSYRPSTPCEATLVVTQDSLRSHIQSSTPCEVNTQQCLISWRQSSFLYVV